MRERQQSIMVGLFMLAGLAALAVMLFWFAETQWLFGKRAYAVTIHFDELSGVSEGTELRMAIGRVGLVRTLRFADPANPGLGVVVEAEVDQGTKIPQNTEAIAHPVAMGFGRGEIRLYPPPVVTEMIPEDGTGRLNGRLAGPLDAIVPPEMVDTLAQAASSFARFADAAVPVAADLDELLRPRTLDSVDEPPPGGVPMLANLSTVVQRFDALLRHANDVLGEPLTKSRLRDAVANVHQMSEDGKVAFAQMKDFSGELTEGAKEARQLVSNLDGAVGRTEQRFEQLLRTATADMEALGRMIAHLESAGQDLAEGGGTAGRFLRDPKLYEEMLLTFQRLNKSVDDLSALLEEWKRSGVRLKGL